MSSLAHMNKAEADNAIKQLKRMKKKEQAKVLGNGYKR